MSLWDKVENTWNGWTGGFGGWLNNAMGQTSAAKQQQNYNLTNGAINQAYALQSGAINHGYQKEFAQNAHQWEIQDLIKAGLNPVLSAGGSGASASGGGVSAGSVSGAGMGSSGINPFQTAIDMWGGAENALLTNATTQNTAAKTEEINANITNINQDTALKYWKTLTEMENGPLNHAQREFIETQKDRMVKMLPHEMNNMNADTFNKTEQGKLARKQRKIKTGEGHVNLNIGPLGKLGFDVQGGANWY